VDEKFLEDGLTNAAPESEHGEGVNHAIRE
jgi:hypothetical protein